MKTLSILQKRGGSFRDIVESFLLGLFFLAFFLFFRPHDPLFIQTRLPVALLIVALITLYYGYYGGFVILMLFGGVMKFYYEHFPTDYFLLVTVFILLFSEFHHFWNRKESEGEMKIDYLRRKFEELANAFYALKTSHDQLERNYVVKPMSLRHAITEIKKAHGDDRKSAFDSFLTLLNKNFSLESGLIAWRMDEGDTQRFEAIATIENARFVPDDPLVLQAIEKKEPVYISENVSTSSRYKAVLPTEIEEEVQALICIEKMPFLAFNLDNLVSMTVLLDYFVYEMLKFETLNVEKEVFPFGSDNLRYEIARLYDLVTMYDVNSTILIFTCAQAYKKIIMDTLIRESVRSLEIYEKIQTPGRGELLMILFPLAGHSSVEGYLQRLSSLMGKRDETLCPYVLFTLKELDAVIHYLQSGNHALKS